MKKGVLLIFLMITFFSSKAQEKKKDTIVKTEVVNIVTKYNPEIADVKKIKKNPTIKLLNKTKKKKLEYTIFSAPVASTFIPKTGVVKGINVGVKERVYNNYLAAGYGNYLSPYAEMYLYHNTRFNNEFGWSTKYNSSQQNINNTLLNSTFSNFTTNAFFKQEARYFNWKINADVQLNSYNWYGLPNDKSFAENVLNSIDEAQTYRYFKIGSHFKFNDSYIDFSSLDVSFFTDNFSSGEILANFSTKLDFPINLFKNSLNAISINTNLEYLKGFFNEGYGNNTAINYNQITANIEPNYNLKYLSFSLKAGLKAILSLDPENNINNTFIFPDILAETTIIKKYLLMYGGLSGNLHTNTYREFTEENPFVSPTLFITQTAETSNFFAGIKGNITRDISYHIKASSKTEEDKPLFIRNNSKSDGTNTISNGQTIKGYEFGNSFTIFYDDVKTTSLYTEIEYFLNKNFIFSTQIEYNNYTTTNALDSFNLPNLQGSFLAKYKEDKWYATATIFYVDERRDLVYNSTFPSSLNRLETLNSFVDVNLNGGYHFNDKFSAFLKLNNVLNTNYQRFANFNVQGFQVLGGITYKFDF